MATRIAFLSVVAAAAVFIAAVVSPAEVHAEKCYAPVDPKLNINNNKPGTACYRQMVKVRKLEFDPRFDCTKSIRLEWVREMEIADRMGCKL